MRQNHINRSSYRTPALALSASAALLIAGLTTGQAMGATWTGTTNSDWNTTTNWDSGAVPIINTNVNFDTATPTAVTLSAAATANNIFFNASSSSYTIGATDGTNAITLNNNAAIQITAPNSAQIVFNAPIIFSGGSTRLTNNSTTGGAFTFNGSIQVNGSSLALQSAVGGGTNYLNGEISGAATINRSGVTGQGLYVISHSNPNFTGNVSLSYSAPLQLTNSGAITNAGLTFGYLGTLQLRSDSNATFGTTGITMTGQSFVDVGQMTPGNGGKTLTLGGNITMSNNTGFTVTDASGSDDTLGLGNVTLTGTGFFKATSGHVTVASITGASADGATSAVTLNGTTDNNRVLGVISDGVAGGDVKVTKSDTATWYLQGDNTYSGATSITGGALFVNGATSGQGNFTVNSGTVLGGAGTIGLASSANSVAVSGKLAPGAALGDIGTLTVDTGNLTITNAINGANTQNLLFDLKTPLNSDKVIVADGLLTIGTNRLEFGDFAFNPLSGFTGGTYILFHSSQTISGTLSSNLTGQINGLDAELMTVGNDIVLTVVPEPASLSILALGALGLLARRRRIA